MSDMGPRPAFRRYAKPLLAGVAVLLLTVAAIFLAAPTSPPPERVFDSAGILLLDADGHRYTYHTFSNTEGLFDLDSDPHCIRNLATTQPKLTAKYRQLLSRHLVQRKRNGS